MIEAPPTPAPDAETEPVTAVSKPRAPLRDLTPQGWRAVMVGAVGAVLVILGFVEFGFTGEALVGAVLCPVLVLLAAIDAQHRLLPNEIVLSASLLVGLIVAATNPSVFLGHLAVALGVGGFLFLFALVFPGGLGMGDAKVGFLLGLALGARTWSAMFVAMIGLFLAALWILVTKGLSARKQSIPFGPFLAAGGILAYFFA